MFKNCRITLKLARISDPSLNYSDLKLLRRKPSRGNVFPCRRTQFHHKSCSFACLRWSFGATDWQHSAFKILSFFALGLQIYVLISVNAIKVIHCNFVYLSSSLRERPFCGVAGFHARLIRDLCLTPTGQSAENTFSSKMYFMVGTVGVWVDNSITGLNVKFPARRHIFLMVFDLWHRVSA